MYLNTCLFDYFSYLLVYFQQLLDLQCHEVALDPRRLLVH